MIKSFSGSHPFRPQCAIESIVDDWSRYQHDLDDEQVTTGARNTAVRVVELVDDGKCPRCRGPLTVQEGEFPAGSRVTSCRCIPICGRCGSDETHQPSLGRPMSRLWQWPLGKGAITRRRNEAERRFAPEKATLAGGGDGPVLLTGSGVTPVDMTPTSGGWAQLGYNDQPDEAERSR